ATNNRAGAPNTRARFGERDGRGGEPIRLQTVPPPTEWEMKHRGVIPFLDPLIRYESSQPGNVLRIFERGGRFTAEIGIPEREEGPGRPILSRLSTRGLGTQNRTDPVMIGLQKTRLFDPTTNFIGTNDHAGDFRQSGCPPSPVTSATHPSP